jgi:AraC-like DNA-binding protein
MPQTLNHARAGGFAVVSVASRAQRDAMKRALHVRPGLGIALHVVQEGGRPLWRVFVEFPSLLLVCAGTKRLRLDGEEIIAREGEMIALAGGAEVEVTNTPPATGPYLAQSLSIDPALCLECERPGRRLTPIVGARRLVRPPEFLRAAFARALVACDESAGPPLSIARHQLQEVVLGLAEHGLGFDLSRLNRISTRVRRLVGSDATRRWRAGVVARQLGMSEATLRRRLEREDTSFRRLLQEVRMGRALVLLQSSELSVVQVALEVGYDSVSQFSARFRRHFGQSPRQLRGAATH